jgi:hypothetical protein
MSSFYFFSFIRFLDYPDFSKPVLQAIHGCLRKGMSVLLPPLNDRITKARELLSRDQVIFPARYL